jgi:dGTPase
MIMQELLGDKEYTFHHAKYGLEIVRRVEKNGKGLNLTYEVEDGIEKHTLGAAGLNEEADLPKTPEGKVVRDADKIAYTCSDLEDALNVGLIKESDVPRAALRLLGADRSEWIGTLNQAVVNSSLAANKIAFTGDVYEAFEEIRAFMYKNVYGSGPMKAEFDKAKKMIKLVFEHVMENQFSRLDQKEAAFKTLDVVACMTDRSIMQYFNENFVPHAVF